MAYFIKAGLWKKAKTPLAGELDLTRLIESGDGSGPSTGTGFTGEVSLSNVLGTYWQELTQTGVITFSESSSSVLGGTDLIKITSNGSAITIPEAWINIGSTEVSTLNGDINRIVIIKTFDEIWYSVVVES